MWDVIIIILTAVNSLFFVGYFIQAMLIEPGISLCVHDVMWDFLDRTKMNAFGKTFCFVVMTIILLPAIIVWYLSLFAIFIIVMIGILVLSPLYRDNNK